MGFATRGDALNYVVGFNFFWDKKKKEVRHVGSY
jgi:hypothetical protein